MASSCPDAATRRESAQAKLQHRPRGGGGARSRPPIGERTARIEGSFRRITVQQLILAWWLYQAGHITRRQHKVYFAAHELHEQRRYTSPERRGTKPLYTTDQIARLVGGGGNPRALRELRGDLKTLAWIGLVSVTKHDIDFADSADQIRLGGWADKSGQGDGMAGFWAMFNAMPNGRRSVPVPRRLLRAMAGGFTKGGAALMTAILIRGLFWHKETSDYRTDGRYKLSWVAEHFGISRRASTEARARLIELGWIEPLDVRQWEMNRWGVRDRIVTEGPQGLAGSNKSAVVGGSKPGKNQPDRDAEYASPNAHSDTGSASLDQTDSPFLKEESLENRKLPGRERSGVLTDSGLGEGKSATEGAGGSRQPKSGRGHASVRRRRVRRRTKARSGPPNIRDIRAADLADTGRLLELHRQAVVLGVASPSEAGRLEFLALAERARTHGHRAGALMFYLLRERKVGYITQQDEDQASRRLKEHLFGGGANRAIEIDHKLRGFGRDRETEALPVDGLSLKDDEVVLVCLRLGEKHRVDASLIAQRTKAWSHERWRTALAEYEDRLWARHSARSAVHFDC